MNRKIANAAQIKVDNIKFQSKLEAKCYTLLKEAGLKFDYEKYIITLFEGFRPTFKIYEVKNKVFKEKKSKIGSPLIRDITYTPDFVYIDDKRYIIIETKGFKNDTYPYKKKLLFRVLENKKKDRDVYFFEPNNITSIKATIDTIKDILSSDDIN